MAGVAAVPIMEHAGNSTARGALARYRAALRRTDALIEQGPAPAEKSPAEIRARAEMRLARLRRFLAYLGNPHQRYPIVHIGGTSGKGSTSTAVAAILTAAGYRTGLHTSPYLQAATEKLQIDGRLIGAEAFADLVDETLVAAEAWQGRGNESLTYGEVWVALVASHFAAERVDAAVIEVGAGGRFDLTNVVTPVVSVITSVGRDHTVTLGETIPEIAWHKAGIIKPGAPVVSAVLDPDAQPAIVEEARITGSELVRVIPGETFAVEGTGEDGTAFRELTTPDGREPLALATPLAGRFQATNAATAVTAVRLLARSGFGIPSAAFNDGLAMARLPGRYEIVQDRPRIILDGAHNPEKIGALVRELPLLRRPSAESRLIVVLGVLEAKEQRTIVELVLPHADELIATSPRVLAKPGASAAMLAAIAREAGFSGVLLSEDDPHAALDLALARTEPERGDAILVTGSLFLVGNVRGRWYPEDEVVLQRTPWPRVETRAAECSA